MAKNRVCAALLLTLAAVTAHAQTVTLRACNPGKTDVDVYFAQGANVVSQHIAPSYCAHLASTQGAMAPGLVAVGFADAQGQWGGVHRYERVPNFGPGVAQSTTQTLSVTHGATRASIPAQFDFQPPKPVCITYRGQPGPLGQAPEYTRCDDFKYDVNVLAFPDTREVAFQGFCQICDDHAEERKTPEQRSLEKQVADLKRAAVDLLPIGMRTQVERDTKRVDSREESKDRYLEMLERDPTKWDHIGWSDVPRYAREVAGNVPNVAMQGSVAVLQGTITGMQRHNASDPYYDVFFQESPDHKFILCTTKLDVLSDLFGANYGTAMVGKKIEVEGKVVGCLGGPGILLKLAHQIKLVGTGPGMVASITPPAFRFPEDPNRPAPAAPVSAEATAAAAAAAAAYEVSATGVAARAAKAAPNAQSVGGGTSLMPFYNPSRDAITLQLRMYCDSIYKLIAIADSNRCAAEVDFNELVSNRKAALRYCFVNNNYVGAGNAGRLKTYDECMNQNDELTALCTKELVHRMGAGTQCSLDHPGDREAALLLKGTDENGAPLVSAATAPGLPASMKTLWAARDRAASTGGASGSAAVASPAPATSERAAAPAQAVPKPAPAAPASPQALPKDRARPTQENMLRLQTCSQEVAKQFPGGIASDPAGFQKAVLACIGR